jgi:L-2,4-diaminobutyrate decarboxylase
MASALLNNGMAIYEMGPFSTVAERLVLEWLAEKMGFTASAGGYLTSGGSAGNLSALLTARRIIVPEFEKDNSRLGIMVSGEAHYSIARSALIMGIPADNVIKVPIGADHRIISSLLPEIMEDATKRGILIFALVANAGTTATGSYDDLKAAASFCKSHGIWFHTDGAHGAAAVLSQKFCHLVEDIGLADSVVVDFHKMFMMPALTTAVVFRDAAHSYATFSQDASYLLKDDGSRPWYDSAMRTLECTKKMMGIKMLYMLRFYGEGLFREYVETSFGLARTLAAMISEAPDFELECQPSCNIVCFRYRPQQCPPAGLDLLNERIRRHLLEDGAFYITKVRLAGGLWLRTTLMNPFTTADDLRALFEKIRDQSIALD